MTNIKSTTKYIIDILEHTVHVHWLSDNDVLSFQIISMAWRKTAVSPLLTHWRYYSLAFTPSICYRRFCNYNRTKWRCLSTMRRVYRQPIFVVMMTSSNGNIFRVTGLLCGEFTGPGEFPSQRPVTRSFDVFFDLRLNKRLSKQPWGWWFETPSGSLWRQWWRRDMVLCDGGHLLSPMHSAH